MAKWARVENGTVREVITSNPSGRYHSSITWVSCSDTVTEGMSYNGSQFSQPATNLDNVKAAKKAHIMKEYESACDIPVAALDTTWNGGFESALKIDGAKRLCESAGQENVTLWDSNNLPHVCSFAEALSVGIAVSIAFQTLFAKKQEKFVAIDGAESVEEVNAINWE